MFFKKCRIGQGGIELNLTVTQYSQIKPWQTDQKYYKHDFLPQEYFHDIDTCAPDFHAVHQPDFWLGHIL
jgi:hypothetical protein